MKPTRLIKDVLLVVAAILFVAVMILLFRPIPASAQSHDPENRWIGQTLRKQINEDHRHVEPRRQEAPPRRFYSPPEPHRHATVVVHPETRVHAYVARKGAQESLVRDALGHIECLPPIEARSHERQSEDGAWDDAQRSWSNTVRWKYGERFGGLQNALTIERRCNVSTVSEGVAGKMIEAVRGAVGADDSGRRWRCEMRASPCVAPVDRDPAIKGDPKQ